MAGIVLVIALAMMIVMALYVLNLICKIHGGGDDGNSNRPSLEATVPTTQRG
jgi:hypothetical protein